jgi:Transcription factor WhiB
MLLDERARRASETPWPVRARCLDWALSHRAAFGIWGGRTAAERHAMGYPGNSMTLTGRSPAHGLAGGQ